MHRHYTVVYRVDGKKAEQDAWWERTIRPLFLKDSEPVCITVISAADEIARLDCIAHIVEGSQYDGDKVVAIEAVLKHPDPLAWWRENGLQVMGMGDEP